MDEDTQRLIDRVCALMEQLPEEAQAAFNALIAERVEEHEFGTAGPSNRADIERRLNELLLYYQRPPGETE